MTYSASYIIMDKKGNTDMDVNIHENESLALLLNRVFYHVKLLDWSFYKVIIKQDGKEIRRITKGELL